MLTDEEWQAAEADELISTYPEWQREVVLKAREVQKTEYFVELPDRDEIDEYEMMERFACEYDDQRTSAELLRSIKGNGAFRRFKNAILDLGIEQKWYDFRAEELESLAVEWLEREKIPYTREERPAQDFESAM